MSDFSGVLPLSGLNRSLDLVGKQLGRDMTIRQLHILCTVAAAGDGGIDTTKLGELTDTSPSAISRNVRVLGAIHYDKLKPGLGLVMVELDPLDNRRRIVRPTPDGVEVVRAFVSGLYGGGCPQSASGAA